MSGTTQRPIRPGRSTLDTARAAIANGRELRAACSPPHRLSLRDGDLGVALSETGPPAKPPFHRFRAHDHLQNVLQLAKSVEDVMNACRYRGDRYRVEPERRYDPLHEADHSAHPVYGSNIDNTPAVHVKGRAAASRLSRWRIRKDAVILVAAAQTEAR